MFTKRVWAHGGYDGFELRRTIVSAKSLAFFIAHWKIAEDISQIYSTLFPRLPSTGHKLIYNISSLTGKNLGQRNYLRHEGLDKWPSRQCLEGDLVEGHRWLAVPSRTAHWRAVCCQGLVV